MQRLVINPREDWEAQVELIGLTFHTIKGETYWDESVCYQFSEKEALMLEDVTNELQGMCLQAVEYVIQNDLYKSFAIPEWFIPIVKRSWERKEPSIYGRFDFSYDGQSPPKLLEYNADTPTALMEAGVIQWEWLQDVFPKADQFNSIHEKLIEQWKHIQKDCKLKGKKLHFSCVKMHDEDLGTIHYLMNTAGRAGIEVERVFIQDIGWNERTKRFVTSKSETIEALFKLYPWEWLIHDSFGKYLLNEPRTILEPAWKMILSNKAILPILWRLFPGHPNLLPTYTFPQLLGDTYVIKPLLSREGANITIKTPGTSIETTGEYGEEGYVYQQYHPLPCFNGNYPVIGSWVIGNESAGIGIREDNSLITKNTSRFIPHFIGS